MLSKINKEELYQYLDFAWALALDPARSGYPTWTDGIKTKEDFVQMAGKGVGRERDEILLLRRNGNVEGWIHYFWEPEERYLQTCVFNILEDVSAAIGEFLAYTGERFPGYHVYMGFPGENREAAECLLRQGFRCVEESFNNGFFLDTYSLTPEQGEIRRIDAENYHDFRILHAPRDGEMYWDSDHILADIPEWNIHVYYKKQRPSGAVYFRSDGPMLEIYGIDYVGGSFDEAVCRALLLRALNEGKRAGAKYMTCFFDEQHQTVASELGFTCVLKRFFKSRVM